MCLLISYYFCSNVLFSFITITWKKKYDLSSSVTKQYLIFWNKYILYIFGSLTCWSTSFCLDVCARACFSMRGERLWTNNKMNSKRARLKLKLEKKHLCIYNWFYIYFFWGRGARLSASLLASGTDDWPRSRSTSRGRLNVTYAVCTQLTYGHPIFCGSDGDFDGGSGCATGSDRPSQTACLHLQPVATASSSSSASDSQPLHFHRRLRSKALFAFARREKCGKKRRILAILSSIVINQARHANSSELFLFAI